METDSSFEDMVLELAIMIASLKISSTETDEKAANQETAAIAGGGSETADYSKHECKFKRIIRNIKGSEQSISARTWELVRLINHPSYPQSRGIMIFLDALIAHLGKTVGASADNRVIYAIAQVLVRVSSKIPNLMDMVIDKLNQECIYTAPKHICYNKKKFRTQESYYRAIGFRQNEDGRIEEVDSSVGRMILYVKLYGAILQTDINGAPNSHGLDQAWTWISRFLNNLPPNTFTTIALQSFIEMAGYAMYRRFKSQFSKIVIAIDQDFLVALRDNVKTSKHADVLRDYLKSKMFMKEPLERSPRIHLASHYQTNFDGHSSGRKIS